MLLAVSTEGIKKWIQICPMSRAPSLAIHALLKPTDAILLPKGFSDRDDLENPLLPSFP